MENVFSLELIVCVFILTILLLIQIQKIITYIISKNNNKPAILSILVELANNEDIQNKVLEIFNEVKMGDFDTFDEYLTYAKNKISKEIFDYVSVNYPEYSLFVTIDNVKIIIDSVLSLLDKKEKTLLEEFDNNIVVKEVEEGAEE